MRIICALVLNERRRDDKGTSVIAELGPSSGVTCCVREANPVSISTPEGVSSSSSNEDERNVGLDGINSGKKLMRNLYVDTKVPSKRC